MLEEYGDPRVKILIRRLRRYMPPEVLDMKLFLPRLRTPPQIEMFYGADNKYDRLHAEHLGDLPFVHLHPIPGWTDHAVLGHLIENELLAGLLAPAGD
jgi:hypothetical protein